jgi:hypothetical protein
MALLPPAFANPRQPLYIDGQEVVRVTSGVLDIQSAARDGSFISLSPVIFTPPLSTIPKYTMIAFPDNSFGFSRTNTPNVPVRGSIFMRVFPSDEVGIDNSITFNGDVSYQGGDVYSEGDINAEGRVTGFAGLRYGIDQLGSTGNPPVDVNYQGITIYLAGYPGGDGAINVTLPDDFFEAANAAYDGATLFRLISNNGAVQTVNVIDNQNPAPVVILSATTNVPSILEAVRLNNTIVTYTTPLIGYSSTQLVLNAVAAKKSKRTVKKL